MNWIKSFIFSSLIMMLKVGAEGDSINDKTSQEISTLAITPLPIVLQMSAQQQESSENKSDLKFISNEMQSKPEETNEVLGKHEIDDTKNKLSDSENQSHKTSNDIEIFEQKPGPHMEKQEEEGGEPEAEPEAEGEGEAEPEAVETAGEEETPNEENPEPEATAEEAAAEPEPEAEPEPVAEPEPEPEPEAAAEDEQKEVEPAPEQPAEEEEKVEAEPEAKPEPEEANKEEPPPEMPNDEPAKDVETPATHVDNDKPADGSKDQMDKKPFTCYTCTSNEDDKCHKSPMQEESCSKVQPEGIGKHNGCYTIYKPESNMTMRGCVDDLAEEGLKDCLSNDELCVLCYTNNCNSKVAPGTAATLQQFNFIVMILISGFSIIFIKKILISFV